MDLRINPPSGYKWDGSHMHSTDEDVGNCLRRPTSAYSAFVQRESAELPLLNVRLACVRSRYFGDRWGRMNAKESALYHTLALAENCGNHNDDKHLD